METEIIKNKGKRLKRVGNDELWLYDGLQWVVGSRFSMTRYKDNSSGINAATFPFKFNSVELRRSVCGTSFYDKLPKVGLPIIIAKHGTRNFVKAQRTYNGLFLSDGTRVSGCEYVWKYDV